MRAPLVHGVALKIVGITHMATKVTTYTANSVLGSAHAYTTSPKTPAETVHTVNRKSTATDLR